MDGVIDNIFLDFAAPELGFSEDVPARTQMSDVYAFGCFYYEVGRNILLLNRDVQIWTLISRGTIQPSG